MDHIKVVKHIPAKYTEISCARVKKAKELAADSHRDTVITFEYQR